MNTNDRCQHSDGCLKSFFTYCPHCHLFLCINHLNQHHDAMKIDIDQTINEVETHRVLVEQQIHKIKQQQTALNDLYDFEIKKLNDIYKFVINISENNYLVISEYERYVKEFQLIKQNHANNSFIQSFIISIDQILQQQNKILESKDEISITTNILSILNNETSIDKSRVKEEEIIVESSMDCHTNVLLNDHHNETESDTLSLKSKSLMNVVHPTCPLSHVNAFGFSINHNIPGMPCDFLKDSNPLTYDRIYYHLKTYHRLRQNVVKIIMTTISSNENKNIDLTSLDIFSSWTVNDILSQGTTLFIGQCPLIQEDIYGLQSQHNVTLCTPRPPLHLYQHLRSFHHFKSNYARRLIDALIKNLPSTEKIFKPNEQIINKSIRPANRTKN